MAGAVGQPQAQTQTQTPPLPRQEPACKRELDHLVDIKVENIGNVTVERRKQLVLQEALEEWKQQVVDFESKVEKRTKRTEQWTNEIYQLAGLYSVFVGVVFTAVLQSTRVQCQHIWSPIVLCVVAYCVLLVVIIKKSKQIEEDRATINEDLEFRKIRLEHIRILKSLGPSRFDFSHPKFEPEEKSAGKKEKGQKRNSKTSSKPWWIIAILTFFTLVLLLSFIHILCLNIQNSCSCASASAP